MWHDQINIWNIQLIHLDHVTYFNSALKWYFLQMILLHLTQPHNSITKHTIWLIHGPINGAMDCCHVCCHFTILEAHLWHLSLRQRVSYGCSRVLARIQKPAHPITQNITKLNKSFCTSRGHWVQICSTIALIYQSELEQVHRKLGLNYQTFFLNICINHLGAICLSRWHVDVSLAKTMM